MDEDFFLYYEEVALCRSAQDRGWPVAFDPSVEVVHLRPLQSRALSPRMRVITRHSKLLYFHKHLPRWQFWGLALVVACEAALRGAWSRFWGNTEAERSWKAIGAMVKAWRRTGQPPLKGPEARELADSVRVRGAA
jgi:GT2 family glycosyltransferase